MTETVVVHWQKSLGRSFAQRGGGGILGGDNGVKPSRRQAGRHLGLRVFHRKRGVSAGCNSPDHSGVGPQILTRGTVETTEVTTSAGFVTKMTTAYLQRGSESMDRAELFSPECSTADPSRYRCPAAARAYSFTVLPGTNRVEMLRGRGDLRDEPCVRPGDCHEATGDVGPPQGGLGRCRGAADTNAEALEGRQRHRLLGLRMVSCSC